MAKPDWFNEEQKRIQFLHKQAEDKERTKTQIENEVDYKLREIAQLESEIDGLNREITEPKLSALLFYDIKYLDDTGNGHHRFTHERVFYCINTGTINTVSNIFRVEERIKSSSPDVIDLTLAFPDKGRSDVEEIAANIKATVDRLLENTTTKSWDDIGRLLVAYYDPKNA